MFQTLGEHFESLVSVVHFFEVDSDVKIDHGRVFGIEGKALIEVKDAGLVPAQVEQTRTQVKGHFCCLNALPYSFEQLQGFADFLLLVGFDGLSGYRHCYLLEEDL